MSLSAFTLPAPPSLREVEAYDSVTNHRGARGNLAQVLAHRASGLPPPIQMCDAIERNLPKLPKALTAFAGFVRNSEAEFLAEVLHFVLLGKDIGDDVVESLLARNFDQATQQVTPQAKVLELVAMATSASFVPRILLSRPTPISARSVFECFFRQLL